MEKVISKDGTPIAYERSGSGPAVILVDGALCSRGFGPSPTLAPMLAKHFTVFAYDRRGRGDSGDAGGWTKERELEDIAALVAVAGGTASLVGLSSGGALALEAAASGLPLRKVVAYEPPFVEAGGPGAPHHLARLQALVEAGRRGDAVRYFMKDMVGAPAFVVFMMRLMPSVWRKLQAVAHTLPYDAGIMGDFTVPAQRLGTVAIPTLIMHGGKTDARLVKAAEAVAAAVPGAQHRVLAGQTHNVKPEVLTPAVVDFLQGA